MTRPAYVIGPEEPLASAVRRLLDRRIGALAVVDDERLVGILSYVDVLDAIFHRLYARPAPSPGESHPAP